MTKHWGTCFRTGAGAAALLLGGTGIFLGTGAAHATSLIVECGGMTEAQAITAGYNTINDSALPGPVVENGTGGNDWIYGTVAADTLSGGGGNDIICGGDNADTIIGNTGNDKLHGGDNADTIYGDDLFSGAGRAGDGDDKLFGENGSDTLYGNGGEDTLRGQDNPIGGGDGGDGGNDADTCTTLEGSPASPTNGAPISCP